jgi:hypothetical protein
MLYRVEATIDELEEKDDSQWSNIKALQDRNGRGDSVRESEPTGLFS